MKNIILNRLREPSTWAGVASIAVSLGLGVPPGLIEAVGQTLAGVAGVLAVVMRERAQ